MADKVKEILLKQMELLQEVSKAANSYDANRDIASMSSAMAELASAYASVNKSTSETC